LSGQSQSEGPLALQEGTINALWLGDSGSVVVVPNSGTLSAGIETMKKRAKQLRLCLAVGVTRMGAWGCGRACETNALNERRRAGFVMANSASDASAPEQGLRRQRNNAELAGSSGTGRVRP
jgi:hypothetical protein